MATEMKIEVEKGKPLVMRMPCNPTTGYLWAGTATGPVEIKQDYEPDEPVMIGSGGMTRFSLTLTGDRGDVLLKHSRPWLDPDPCPLQVWNITLVPKQAPAV